MMTFLLTFYRRYLKRYPVVHRFALFLYFACIKVIHLSYQGMNKLNFVRSYRLIPISRYASLPHTKSSIVGEPEAIEIESAHIYPQPYSALINGQKQTNIFPTIYRVTVSNAVITGKSNFILTKKKALHHDLYDFRRDSTSEELHIRYGMTANYRKLIRYRKPRIKRTIHRAIAFNDACSGNYAHWLTEILPRIGLYYKDGMVQGQQIILDDDLHPNLMESFNLVTDEPVQALAIPRDESWMVDNLDYISATGYVPFDRRPSSPEGHSHGQFSPLALQNIVKIICRKLSLESTRATRRIFIRRNSGSRMLNNAAEIEQLLIRHQFEVIEPEKLDFAEQVRIFSEAEVVVGATGAAMANTIFCKPSSKLIVMMAMHEAMPYGYWHNMAAAVGNRITYVLGRIVGQEHLGIHANFIISPNDLLEALNIGHQVEVERLH